MAITIDKASEDLTTLHKLLTGGTDPSFLEAILLGREAILRVQNLRILFPTMNADLLPGETKD